MSDRINERAYKTLVEDLPKAKAITRKRLKDRHMGAESVWAQLEFIEGFVKERKCPSEEDIESITLNVFCCKELDGQDDEWSDPLSSVATEFKLLAQPEREDFHDDIWRLLAGNLPEAFEKTDACLKLYPNHPQFLAIREGLNYIESIHRQHRKPTKEEWGRLLPSLSGVTYDEPAKNLKEYANLIDRTYMEWEALCTSPSATAGYYLAHPELSPKV